MDALTGQQMHYDVGLAVHLQYSKLVMYSSICSAEYDGTSTTYTLVLRVY